MFPDWRIRSNCLSTLKQQLGIPIVFLGLPIITYGNDDPFSLRIDYISYSDVIVELCIPRTSNSTVGIFGLLSFPETFSASYTLVVQSFHFSCLHFFGVDSGGVDCQTILTELQSNFGIT